MSSRRKLIEVALPLEAINVASADEKSVPRRGHPATLHLWWARRPLAACRAVIFASLVDDPSSDPERFPTEKAVTDERLRLFAIIERLVRWENSTNASVLESADAEIRRSTGGEIPPLVDPFSGGGSIPYEAQRLGLTAYASDLNPVAALITKALVEIPPKFRDRPPVHPEARRGVGASGSWRGASGLAEDVRRYGHWIQQEAERRIGHLYPQVGLPRDPGGINATVIAWLWARTVTCPNPACGARMPLVSSFVLSTKKGKETWIQPIVDRVAKTVEFAVRSGDGTPPAPPKFARGANFRCLVCDQVSPDDHIKSEGRAGRMGSQLIAVVAQGSRSRIFLAPTEEHERVAASAAPTWAPDAELANDPRALWTVNYGLTRFRDLFTPRQLVTLTTLADLVREVRGRLAADARAAGLPEGEPLRDGGVGAAAYAEAVSVLLAFAVSKLADWSSALCSWIPQLEGVGHTFKRQALPMIWDFVEINPLGGSVGNFLNHTEWVADSVENAPAGPPGFSRQSDATHVLATSGKSLVSTDPPYYDNIGYADLSDFFYVWLRRSLSDVYPDLFGTVLTPKSAELVATPYRHGNEKRMAEEHFETGLRSAFDRIRTTAHPDYPVTIYYAFKQTESRDSDDRTGRATSSTGWETMLEGLLESGFTIVGTWPMRTERAARSISIGTNALASSIVLVCRPRAEKAGLTTRKDLVAALKSELPEALRTLQHGNIAPVDLAQASIGPGMAIFSRYAKVLEPDGTPMRVRTALALINSALDEILAEQESEFDADTRWAIAWYEQYGLNDAAYGVAETLSKAKNSSIHGLAQAGIVAAARGRVRLLARSEFDGDWDPATDTRIPVWEATQRLIRALLEDGEATAANLLSRVGGLGDVSRDLAYRLYQVAERKGWTEDARAYNALVVAWPDLVRGAEQSRRGQPAQASLGLES